MPPTRYAHAHLRIDIGEAATLAHTWQKTGAAAAALVTGHTHMVELRAWQGVVFVATLTAAKCHISRCSCRKAVGTDTGVMLG